MVKSRVIILNSSRVNSSPSADDKEHLKLLLTGGFKALMDTNDAHSAVRTLFPGNPKVGIKPNCVAGIIMSSSPILCMALCELLQSAGIRENDIIIWERSERELRHAGYELNNNSNKLRIIANDSPGIGYSKDFSSFGRADSLVTRVLTDMVDYNINFPILKDHSIAGLCGGLKNMYGAVHNPNKYHDHNCDPYAADINCFPVIKNKHRLSIMDCFNIQYNAGPAYYSSFATTSNKILMSTDPVALDTIALRMLDEIRIKYGLQDLKSSGRYPAYLQTAADEKHLLGNCELDKIEQIEVSV
jgi:uncharacterized protein (DUF362 family)